MKDDDKSYSKKILDFIEKDRFSLSSAVIYIFIVSVIRSLLEAYISGYGTYTLNIMAQHVLLSYPEILMGALVIYGITRSSIKKIWNVILFGFWILITPPLIDYFIFGKSGVVLIEEYSYQSVDNIFPLLTNLWNPFYLSKFGSNGILIMLYGMMIGSAFYVALKTELPAKIKDFFHGGAVKDVFRSISKVILSFFGIGLVTWFIGSFMWILSIGGRGVIVFNRFTLPYYTKYYRFFEAHNYDYYHIYPQPNSGVIGLVQSLALQQRNLMMGAFFIILTVVFASVSLYLNYRKHFIAMVRTSKISRVIMISVCGLLGVASIHLIDHDFSKGLAVDPFYVLHFPYVFFLIISIMLMIVFDVLIDQLFAFNRDEERDDPLSNGIVPKYHYKQLAASFALTALFLSVVLGWKAFFICLIWILISIFYRGWGGSKREGIVLGLYGVFAMLMGIYTPGSWKALIMEYEGGEFIYASKEYISRAPPIHFKILLIATWIFLAIALFSYFKTVLRDKELDKRGGRTKDLMMYVASGSILIVPVYIIPNLYSALLFGCVAIGTIVWFKMIKISMVLKIGFILTATILFSLLI